jgi:hypothetical protein
MGCPHQDFIAYNADQRDMYIYERRKLTDLYMSVYRFNQIDKYGEIVRESAFVDKIFFDFDSSHWLTDIRILHQWCKLNGNIIHRSQFSGRGAQSLIYIVPNIMHKKEAVGNFQRWIQKKLNLEIDSKVIGDTSRIFRIPNTYNFKARRYCIPIPEAILDDPTKNEEWFYRHATKKQQLNPWCGLNLLNINKFDVDEMLYMEYNIEYNLKEIDNNIAEDFKEFPPCMQSFLSTPDLRDDQKFLIVLYLKDQIVSDIPYDSQDIVNILHRTLSENEFNHYFNSKCLRGHQGHNGVKFKSAMKNNKYLMPSCRIIKQRGWCPKDCGRLNPIYDW